MCQKGDSDRTVRHRQWRGRASEPETKEQREVAKHREQTANGKLATHGALALFGWVSIAILVMPSFRT